MRLNELIGQSMATTILMQALERQALSHAYIFHGPDGVGKETCARALANHLCCKTGDACGICVDCQRFIRGSWNGWQEVTSETSIGIDIIRNMQERSYLTHDDYLVWVIKDAHKMTLEAANSFLKLLEEPPARTVFILLTENLGQIIPTIKSRCQLVRFQRLSINEVYAWCRNNLVQYGQTDLSDEQIRVIAQMARGSIGRAIQLATGPQYERRQWLMQQLVALPQMPIPQVLGLSYTWDENRDTVLADLQIMLQWYRDLWCIKFDLGELIYNVDFKNEMMRISKRYTLEALAQITKEIGDARINILRNVRPRFLLGRLLLLMRKGALA